MYFKIDQLARITPKERKILEGITKKNCLEGCQYGKFTSEHNKITEPIDEYLAGHKNNKPRGTRVSLEPQAAQSYPVLLIYYVISLYK
jgi:hypothetical protein